MTNVIRGFLLASFGVVIAAKLSVAAPATKEREEKLEPPTAKQFAASVENLKQIGIAIHNHCSANNDALPTNVLGKDNKPLLSWRVQILPYIEEEALFKKFKLDEPWDSENNKKLIDKMPKLYAPIRVKTDKGMTFYRGFTGSSGMLSGKYQIGNVPDGTSNTFMVAEGAKPVVWTQPSELEFNGKDLPELGGMFDGKFHALMGDGSVNRFRKGILADTLKMLIDPADGNVLPEDYGIDRDDDKK